MLALLVPSMSPTPARAASPVPAPQHGDRGTVPICGDGGSCLGYPGPQGDTAQARPPVPLREQPWPSRRDPSPWRGTHRGMKDHGLASQGFSVSFSFSQILKKICNDFPGNKSLTCSCQWTEIENGLWGFSKPFGTTAAPQEPPSSATAAEGRGPGCAGHDGGFPGAPVCTQAWFRRVLPRWDAPR